MDVPGLIDGVLACEPRAVARAISLVEDGDAGLPALSAGIYEHTGHATTIAEARAMCPSLSRDDRTLTYIEHHDESVKNAEELLDDTFLVISGDALTDIDLAEVIRFHKEKGGVVTIALKSVPDPLEFGVVITAEDGRIERFLEKPSWSQVMRPTPSATASSSVPNRRRQHR